MVSKTLVLYSPGTPNKHGSFRIKEPRKYASGEYRNEYIPHDGRWTFNGDVERPTFSPSVNVRWELPEGGGEERNHFFVRDGKIEYCGDCTHELAGQTHNLVPFTEPEIRFHIEMTLERVRREDRRRTT